MAGRCEPNATCAAPVFLLLATLGLAVLWTAAQPIQLAYQHFYVMSGIAGFGCL